MQTLKRIAALVPLLGFLYGGECFAQPAPPPLPPVGGIELGLYRFDSTNWASARGDLPLSFSNILNVPTWDSNGLFIDTNVPAWLQYPIYETDHTNFACQSGSLSVWLLTDWASSNLGGTGPQDWGRIVDVGQFSTNAQVGWFSLLFSRGGDYLSLCGQGQGTATNYVIAPISLDNSRWHWICATWSETNSALYLDGASLVTNGLGVAYCPGAEVLSNGFFVGSDSATGMQQVRGTMDDLRFWDYPLDAEMISEMYADAIWQVFPLAGTFGPMEDPPLPPGFPIGGGSGDGGDGGGGTPFPQYTDSDFWLELLPLGTTNYTNEPNFLSFILHDTTNIATNMFVYQILGSESLGADAFWMPEATFLGASNANSTPVVVALDGSPVMFYRASASPQSSNQDTDGGGLPDWWQLEYFGHIGVDPYGDPAGDGWSNLQKFQSGMDPTVIYAPPPPGGVTATLSTNGTVVLNWASAINLPTSGAGAVTGYTVSIGSTNFTVGAGQTNLVISGNPEVQAFLNDSFYNWPPEFSLGISYQNANSQLISSQELFNPRYAIEANIVRGGQGHLDLVVSRIPTNVKAIRVFVSTDLWYNFLYPYWTAQYLQAQQSLSNQPDNYFFDVPVSALTNGIYAISDSEVPPYGIYIFTTCAIGNDGTMGSPPPDEYSIELVDIPFIDGSIHLKQNLDFWLRAATQPGPFSFVVTDGDPTYPRYRLHAMAGNSPCAGFHSVNYGGVYGGAFLLNEFGPFEDNYFYRNFVFTPSDVHQDGSIDASVSFDSFAGFGSPNIILNSEKYVFDTYGFAAGGNTNPPPAMLGDWTWNYFAPGGNLSWIGMFQDATEYPILDVLNGSQANFFGLPYQSVKAAYADTNGILQLPTITVGSPLALTVNTNYNLYPEVAQAVLQTTNYCFARPTLEPLPDDPNFSPTNLQPLMIASVGQRMAVTGWALRTVTNSENSPTAYLEQYFSQAFLADTNGNPATPTGILSPYGEFFPTEPGLTLLTTMTNSSGQAGRCPVYTIGLFTDGNHDGTIETRFSGPDFPTTAQPFRFWINDNHDSGEDGGNGIPGQVGNASDGQRWTYSDGSTNIYKVQGVRDLVDYFPVSLSIGSLFQSNALWAGISPDETNYHFRLKQADGALRFAYTGLTPTNFMDYLRVTNTARSLAEAKLTTINADGVDLPSSFLSGAAASNQSIIIVEAWEATAQPLVLEVWQNTNLLASTSLPLSITGVEQMFRHKNLMLGQTAATGSKGPPDRLADSDVPNEPDNNGKNFVFLHGYNVNPNQARGWFADLFKRMYWSGSHARFYGVTWEGSDSQVLGATTLNFHSNVVNAINTAPLLDSFLNSLSGTNTVAAHSLGNMVALATLNDFSNQTFNTYCMIDAAVAMEAVQSNAPPDVNLVHPDWVPYATRLYAYDWHSLFSASDARSRLSWISRMGNLQNATVYNFYSSGEEVLREYTEGYPPSELGGAWDQVYWYLEAQVVNSGVPSGSYVWCWQELLKGSGETDGVIGSTHGGWKFNYNPPYFAAANEPAFMTPAQANETAVPNSLLQSNAFFDVTSTAFGSVDTALYGAGGSTYAQTNRNRILSDAIPALTLPIGANPLPAFNPTHRNFDMQALYENGWPSDRSPVEVGQPAPGEWHHSDVRQVAYTFTYQLFTNIVTLGSLK